jgi:hypothetical protein
MNERLLAVSFLALLAAPCAAGNERAILRLSASGSAIYIDLTNHGEAPFLVFQSIGMDTSIRVFDANGEVHSGIFRYPRSRTREPKVSLGAGQSLGAVWPKQLLIRDYHLTPGCYTVFAEFRNTWMGPNAFPQYLKSNRIRICNP